MLALLIYLAAAQKSNLGAAAQVAEQAREYRVSNEHRMVRELVDLLAIPNIASDTANIQRNAAKLV